MKIGFIGAGKMALALAKGLLTARSVEPSDMIACARSTASQTRFLTGLQQAAIAWTTDPLAVVRHSDLIVLAVKPKDFPALLPTLTSASAGKLFLSVAAGITLAQIEKSLAPTARVVRAMPNTPSLIGYGASAYTGGHHITESDYAQVHHVLTSVGHAVQVEENQLNAVTALSGSGPAYVFEIIEALIEAGVAQGLPVGLSRTLVVQTVLGAAKMVEVTGADPEDLAAQVKSPGGTTVAGCEVLTAAGLPAILQNAVAAAKARADELGKLSG